MFKKQKVFVLGKMLSDQDQTYDYHAHQVGKNGVLLVMDGGIVTLGSLFILILLYTEILFPSIDTLKRRRAARVLKKLVLSKRSSKDSIKAKEESKKA
jgi:hypothetical protein